MTATQVVKTSVTVHNSPIKDYVNSDDHAQPTLWNDSLTVDIFYLLS